MCGRYVATTPTSVLADAFDVDEVADPGAGVVDAPNYNVAPTDPVPAIAINRAGTRVLGRFRWGLVPSWAPDTRGAAGKINARSESILTKPAYRTAIARRRCLIPADGFYEWERRTDGSKQAWFMYRSDGHPLAFAGVWEVWRDPAGDPGAALLRTCAVITTAANGLMAPVHDRMPAILERDSWDVWLDRENADGGALVELLTPAAEGVITRYPVRPAVNSVRNNGPELIEPVAEMPPPPVALELL